MKTVLLTGANGFLGSNILRKLIEQDCHILALRRAHSDMGLVEDIKAKVEWRDVDILDITELHHAMEGVDEVYHTAALVSFQASDKEALFKVNTEGTSNVVNCSLAQGVKKLLYVSSIAALGRNSREGMIDESQVWEDNKLNSDYAMSKFLAEKEVMRGIAEGLPAVIINPSLIIGKGDWSRGSAQIFTRIWEGLRFYTDGSTGFVDVRDVASLAIQLMNSEITGERYIVSAGDMTFKDFFEKVAEALGKKAPDIRIGKLLSELALLIEGIRSVFRNKPAFITRSNARSARHKYLYSNKKVIEATGFTFIPLNQSIEEAGLAFKKSVKQVGIG